MGVDRWEEIRRIVRKHLDDPQKAFDEIRERRIPCDTVDLYNALQEANAERTAAAHRRIDINHMLLMAFVVILIAAGLVGSIWPFLFQN